MPRVAKRKYSDEQLLEGLRSSESIADATRRLGVGHVTLYRRCGRGELAKAYQDCANRGRALMREPAFRKTSHWTRKAETAPAGGA